MIMSQCRRTHRWTCGVTMQASQHFPPSQETHQMTRRGYLIKEKPLMENTQEEELRAYLMQTSEEFRRLAAEHGGYHERLEAVGGKAYSTVEDEIEENRLKKLKLHLKDRMNEILARNRHQRVA